MKKNINYVLTLSILLVVVGVGGCKSKELTKEEAFRLYQIRKILNEKNYTFVATAVVPTDLWMGSGARGLTSRYTFEVSTDSIVTKLPYMGQSYIAVPGKENDGISFTSTDFKQEVELKDKNAILVTLTPKDVHRVRYITLTVMTNGVANLSIQELSRPPATYEGILELKK
jgi:hypothetical protein